MTKRTTKLSSRSSSIKQDKYKTKLPVRNKILLIFIELVFGQFGIDRFYMKNFGAGMTKLLLVLFGVIFLISGFLQDKSNLIIVGSAFLLINAAWSFFDTIVVLVNALTGTPENPWTFGKNVKFDRKDLATAQIVAILLGVFIFLVQPAIVFGITYGYNA